MSFLILEINVVPCNRSKTLKKCQMQNRRQATDVKVLLKSLQLGYIIYNNIKLLLFINRNNNNSSQSPKFRNKYLSLSLK